MSDETTKFFYELTPDKVLDSVEVLGTRCTGRSFALNSMENRVYEVELDIDDSEVKNRWERSRVVKFYRPGRWSKEQILEEHQFLAELQAEHIRVGAPLTFEDGSTLRELPDTSIWYSVFPKIGGRLLDEFQEEQLDKIGRLLARLHSIGASKKAEHRIELSAETYALNALDYLLEEEAIPETMEQRYIDVVESICDISAPWFEGVPVQRIHGDFHFGNILWDDEGCIVVDFDDMVRGPCVQDIWLCAPGRDEETDKTRERILSTYSEMREFDYSTLRLIEPLRAFRIVHFSAWILRRWEDPAFPRTFEMFGSNQYWREQLIALEEVLHYMHTGE